MGIIPQAWDQEAYRRAVSHFRRAWEAFQEAGPTFEELVDQYVDALSADIKPYLLQFKANNMVRKRILIQRRVNMEPFSPHVKRSA